MTAQQLKNSILQLAVQGKLVQQYPEDGAATVLLKHIAQQKSDLIKDGVLKKEKPLPTVDADALPFDIPESWVWIRLGDFCSIYNGNSINAEEKVKKYSKKCVGHSFIATKDVGFDHSINYDNGVYIPLNLDDFKIAPAGSVLLCMEGGSAGRKIGILEQDVCFGNKLCCLTPFVIFNKYLYYFLQSPAFFSAFTDLMTGIIGGVGAAKIKSIVVPVPPLAEQKRIVAKIEELLPFVSEYDEAEKRLTALKAEFPDKLRQSILQQAIQGELTDRDSSDEPARELVKRIKQSKDSLLKAGKIRKEKVLPPISDDEKPFKIPETWEWVRLSDVCNISDGTHQTPKYVDHGVPFISAQNVKPYRFIPEIHRDVSREDYLEYNKVVAPEKGDILMTRVGAGIGEAAIIDQTFEFSIYVSLTLIKRYGDELNMEYILHVLNSPQGRKLASRKTLGKGASQGNLNLVFIREFVVPIPPLAEQQRIVDRVNELLAVCEGLK